jgi:2-polyprenyl-3-methyl-5-hydroxy-6-metoxy-1,4-benzoquinol methylase
MLRLETIKRTKCCICDADELVDFRTIPDFPVYMGVSELPQSEDIFLDQIWILCDSCKTLQLGELVPLTQLYSNNHHTEVVGDTWARHHFAFSEFIELAPGDRVCEIGSAHDHLATLILDNGIDVEYLSVEPDPTRMDPRVEHIRDFAENQLEKIAECNVVIHSHVLEHVYNPRLFLNNLSSVMKENERMYVSFPNIAQLLAQFGVNGLNFEHTYFLSKRIFLKLIGYSGLTVNRYKEFEKHSYFFELVKKDMKNEPEYEKVDDEHEAFNRLWDGLQEFVDSTILELERTTSPTYIFGAHIFSQALLSLGLKKSPIQGILDNSVGKQGKRLYGSKNQTYAPDEIKNLPEVNVILRASHYQDEIKRQLLSVNPRVNIIE